MISRQNKLFLLTGITFLVIYIVLFELILKFNNGVFAYCLDDTYIHLSIAKNLAEYSVWGVTKYEFAPASSSPLYTLLISGLMKLFGNNVYYPLMINVLTSLCLIYIISMLVSRLRLSFIGQYLLNSALLFFLPLNILIFIGMEHTLQCLLAVVISYSFIKYLESIHPKYLITICLTLGLGVVTRFEIMFLAIVIFTVFLYKRDYKASALILLSTAITLIPYMIFNYNHNGHFFPNSVLIKGRTPELYLLQFPYRIKETIKYLLMNTNVLLPLSAVAIYLWYRVKNKLFRLSDTNDLYAGVILAVIIIFCFSTTYPSILRYGAFIYCLVIPFVIAIAQSGNFKSIFLSNKLIMSILILATSINIYHSAYFTLLIPQMSNNIKSQQIEMANYLKVNPNIKYIAANDIGAISYYNDIHLLDLFGLATTEVAEYSMLELRNKSNTKEEKQKSKKYFFRRLTEKQKTELIMIYNSWFQGSIPEEWYNFKTMVISNNIICGDSAVHFYKMNHNSH